MTVDVVITGDKELVAKLSKLGSELTKFRPVLDKIGEQLKSYYADAPFNSHGGIYGTPWAKLAKSTQRYKIKHYPTYAAVPLMRTGTMRRSWSSKATDNSLVVKNTSPYFDYHQSTAPRHKLPRRQVIGISRDVKELIEVDIKEDIHRKIAAL